MLLVNRHQNLLKPGHHQRLVCILNNFELQKRIPLYLITKFAGHGEKAERIQATTSSYDEVSLIKNDLT